jgi:hypothetical protein
MLVSGGTLIFFHTGYDAHPASYREPIGGCCFPGGRATGSRNFSPLPRVKIKNAWSYTSAPAYVFMAWCLIKHGDNASVSCRLKETYGPPNTRSLLKTPILDRL